ncbi:hypothetical protein VPH35_039960 [Triticum aestivum]
MPPPSAVALASPTHDAVSASPSTPPPDVSGEFGGDLHEPPGGLASRECSRGGFSLATAASWGATSTNRLAISAGSFTLAAALAGGPGLRRPLPALHLLMPMACPHHLGQSCRSSSHNLSFLQLSSACVCTL